MRTLPFFQSTIDTPFSFSDVFCCPKVFFGFIVAKRLTMSICKALIRVAFIIDYLTLRKLDILRLVDGGNECLFRKFRCTSDSVKYPFVDVTVSALVETHLHTLIAPVPYRCSGGLWFVIFFEQAMLASAIAHFSGILNAELSCDFVNDI